MYEWVNIPPPMDWKVNRESFLQFTKVAEKDWGSAWSPDSWRNIEEQFERLSLISTENEIDVVIMAFPVAFQVYSEYVEDLPQQRLGKLSNKYGFDYIDLLPVLRENRNLKLYYDQCHLREKGHELVAKTMAKPISKRRSSPRKRSRRALG